jgi:hypothetical protein
MTLVSLPGPIAWPGICQPVGQPTLSTSATLDAAGEYVSYVFSAREDMTISHVGFRAGTATGSPTIEVRIETVDASGLPSGTLWATNTNGTTGTITSNTDVLQALTASASITKGQVFCVMMKYASGTSQIIQHTNNCVVGSPSSLPYQVINTGTPTKSTLSAQSANIALGSSSTTFYYVPGAMPISASAAGTFNNTNSAKRGLRFVIPMNCRAVGLRNFQNTSVGDFNAVLYNDAGTELSSSSTAYDGDHNSAANNGVGYYYFDNPVTLTAGTAYRIAIEPSSATNANVWTLTLPSSNYFTATPARSTAVYASFATATWTDSTTQLPVMDLLIDQVDDGSGSGGTTVVGVIGG